MNVSFSLNHFSNMPKETGWSFMLKFAWKKLASSKQTVRNVSCKIASLQAPSVPRRNNSFCVRVGTLEISDTGPVM